MNKVFVTGVGMIPFAKPGASAPYHLMAGEATRAALQDAGVDYSDIEQAYVGYVYGDSTCGQKALYGVGMTGIPIVNVNNNCSTGSTALFLARQAIASGAADCVLVLGFEQMSPGALGSVFTDRPAPFDDFDAVTDRLVGKPEIPLALRYFGGAGLAHMEKYGTPLKAFAADPRQGQPPRREQSAGAVPQGSHGPGRARRTDDLARRDDAPDGLPADLRRRRRGAGLGSLREKTRPAQRRLHRRPGHDDRPRQHLRGQRHDAPGRLRDEPRGRRQGLQQAGIGPDDLDVIELHDCFAHNELITYEALGLCPEGGADKFIRDGDNTYGGKVVTNPSGGLLSKGHPLGATGLAQCFELTQQLRGSAGARQVEGARTALQHNLGLGGACVVTLYQAA